MRGGAGGDGDGDDGSGGGGSNCSSGRGNNGDKYFPVDKYPYRSVLHNSYT